ncbi:MAG: TetR/AcrR family transcriptional regulator [Chloroflexota bacterium]
MARQKEFDREAVLERAMRLFWRKGYEATSISDLVNQMGINRGSIYDTFGDKQSLYYAALDYYQQTTGSNLLNPIAELSSPLAAIRLIFANLVDEAICDDSRDGCFAVNAAMELAAHNHQIAKRSKDAIDGMTAGFQGGLERAIELGELDSERDTLGLAQFLVNGVLGIRTMAKMNPDRSALNDIVATTLSVLK